jgi:hypothetical protein
MFIFAGIYADSVTVNSDTSATATFNNGIPLTLATQPSRGSLIFQQNTAPAIQQWAVSVNSVANPISASSIDTGVSCSFAGGCQVSITQTGLLANL